MDFVGKNLGRR